ncbi:hypothetical protein [Flavobacterium sp. NKUCC04_CG]|uniref:hypothetical protein n=1 Tax=Flavobacterium sp. NKUCC04_CG TaxID=2842121 RepID=UPI001C5B8CF9|nr:hypothetical protein [Flavobacterium sp. NKUCC04_CG]MBW3517894.1 hypothetical protein [Flavobacterium sp. NKUCC04_CG]
MTYNPTNIISIEQLKNIVKSNKINCDIIIRGEQIKSLGDIEQINGFLGISDSNIEDLGNLVSIQKDFWISSHTVLSKLTSLNNLEYVGGDLSLRYTNIKKLGNLKNVQGKLSLRDTQIECLGILEYVGGDLYLPKKLENIIDTSRIEVKGKIRFWNDSKIKKDILDKNELGLCKHEISVPKWEMFYIYSYSELKIGNSIQQKFYYEYKKNFFEQKYLDLEGNNNYVFLLLYDLLENYSDNIEILHNYLSILAKHYPITNSYINPVIIQKLEDIGKYDEAWGMLKQNNYISIETVMKFEEKLQKKLIDGQLIVQLAGFTHLTEFGQKNINEIAKFAKLEYEKYEIENGNNFFQIFIKQTNNIRDYKSNTYILEDYKDYFLSISEYFHYKKIDEQQIKSNCVRKIPHVVEKAIYNQLRLILKKSEDSYRSALGLPKVGEGWISETELFYNISNYFIDIKVLHHASPSWLGRQHLDIYIPSLNIAIEYQGVQHYRPIDFFGGLAGYEKTVQRDKLKKELCEANNCYLMYVRAGYNLSKIIKTIENYKRQLGKKGHLEILSEIDPLVTGEDD